MHFSVETAAAECRNKGSTLASFKTLNELEAIKELVMMGKRMRHILVGLHVSDKTLPVYYRKLWQWTDRSISYSARPGVVGSPLALCPVLTSDTFELVDHDCDLSFDIICEYDASAKAETNRTSLSFLNFNNQFCTTNEQFSLVRCPQNHLTHDFLSCDSPAERD